MQHIFGYARVSTTDQNEARQIESLKAAGCKQIYLDKYSGKDFERPAYQKMIRAIRKGDTIFIHSLDRLGRNYNLIKEQWEFLIKKKKVDIVVLDMPLLDTRKEKNLIGGFVSDIVLQILAFVSQMERDNIKKRQAEGIAAAKARGVKLGRRENPLPKNFVNVRDLWLDGHISGIKAAKICQMPQSTFYRKARICKL